VHYNVCYNFFRLVTYDNKKAISVKLVALRALEHTAESSAKWSNGITGLEVYQPSEKAAEVSHYSNAAIVHEIVLFLGQQKGKNSPSSFKELKAALASKQIYLGKQRLLQIVTRYREGCGSGIFSCRSGSIFKRAQIRMPWLIMTHSYKKIYKIVFDYRFCTIFSLLKLFVITSVPDPEDRFLAFRILDYLYGSCSESRSFHQQAIKREISLIYAVL
jgi:hypothetical protein